MKITRKQLRKLIQETVLSEAEDKKIDTAIVHNKDADSLANSILKPNKSSPSFKIHLNSHTAYDAYVKPTGQISGKFHFTLVDPTSDIQFDAGGHIDIPGFSDKEDTHAGGEVELAKHLKNQNFDIFLRGEAQTHLDLDHHAVHISLPDTAVTFGVKGTLGKHKKVKGNH